MNQNKSFNAINVNYSKNIIMSENSEDLNIVNVETDNNHIDSIRIEFDYIESESNKPLTEREYTSVNHKSEDSTFKRK